MRPRSLLLLAICTLPTLSAQALDRVALVIGNDAYPSAPLQNAVRDATAIRDLLAGPLGFPAGGIHFATDTTRIAFFEQFEAFKKASADAKIVLVYYAGHGMESLDGRENFLIPVDVDIAGAVKSEATLRASGINLMTLSSDLAAVTDGAKLILMDCCRERPTGRGGTRAGGGLVTYADNQIPADTLMILAAAPNRLASDGEEHGPFTEALIQVLPQGGLNLMDAFFAVSDRVQESTQHQQVPWLKFDGSGRVFREHSFLAPGAAPLALSKTPAMPAAIPTTPAAPADTASPLRRATRDRPYVNPLGMEFLPLPGHDGILLARTETRVADFRAFAAATGLAQPGGASILGTTVGKTTWYQDKDAGWNHPGFPQTDSHPVVCVSRDEAIRFCQWLETQDPGKRYRLPTDAEWSAALVPGDRYPWGSAWPPPKSSGNYPGKEVRTVFPNYQWTLAYNDADDAPTTAPVGSFKPNAHGFADLGGNAWEWCSDDYRPSLNDPETLAAIPGLASPQATNGSTIGTMRGGSWDFGIERMLRSDFRLPAPQTARSANFGFRVVVTDR
ncbi:MAG TPA: SUMF1/EgtB/PvdO family nonheme iron enzyme [Bacteroidia bacterium]|nr:SUMF1/EgtB/PvdO family nonheme iron enzyme [Bacteroidia bacterium]